MVYPPDAGDLIMATGNREVVTAAAYGGDGFLVDDLDKDGWRNFCDDIQSGAMVGDPTDEVGIKEGPFRVEQYGRRYDPNYDPMTEDTDVFIKRADGTAQFTALAGTEVRVRAGLLHDGDPSCNPTGQEMGVVIGGKEQFTSAESQQFPYVSCLPTESTCATHSSACTRAGNGDVECSMTVPGDPKELAPVTVMVWPNTTSCMDYWYEWEFVAACNVDQDGDGICDMNDTDDLPGIDYTYDGNYSNLPKVTSITSLEALVPNQDIYNPGATIV